MGWRDKIRDPNCTLCPLHETAEHVCLMGDGKRSAKVMLIGEAPGEREDDEHRAFVGPAGQLLDSLLPLAGLDRSQVYVSNAAKCRPPGNRTPTRGESKICAAAYLTKEIQATDPELIVLLGNAALQAVARKSGITKHRGRELKVDGRRVFPVFHPAYALRSPQHLPTLKKDFERLGGLLGNHDGRNRPALARTKTYPVRTTAALKSFLREFEQAEENSFDIETTGLQEWAPGAKIVSIAFTFEEGTSFAVPLHHRESTWSDPARVLRHLKPYLQRPIKHIAHNGKFDCRWLAANGVFVPLSFDTMLAAHLLDENRPKALGYLSEMVLDVPQYKDMVNKADLYNEPLKRVLLYNGKDTDYTLRLYHIFRQQLEEEPGLKRLFTKLVMPAANALTRVELGGIYVDAKRLKKQTAQAQRQRAYAKAAMLEYTDPINFNSPQQVSKWLFGDLGLSPLEKTKTGADSTAESTLLRLAKQHDAAQHLLDYRLWTKRLNTYLEPWEEKRDEHSRIHTNYKMHGTTTGRLSSESPNLQQVPRASGMRTIFGAAPGWLFLAADYSQVELRIAAMLADETHMLRLFAQGVDIHLATAVAITGKRPEDITPEERKLAKAVNFGFLYGMGWRKFIQYALDSYDVEVSEYEAQEFRAGYFRSYPALLPWHERQRRLVGRYHRVRSRVGRVRHLPDVLSRDSGVQAEAERQAINSPVQSLASDICLMSLVRVDQTLPRTVVRVVATTHDELGFEVRKTMVDEVAPQIRSIMEDTRPYARKFGAQITVPLEVEMKIGKHWGDGELIPR